MMRIFIKRVICHNARYILSEYLFMILLIREQLKIIINKFFCKLRFVGMIDESKT